VGDAEASEDLGVEAPRQIEVGPEAIRGQRLAIGDEAVPIRQDFEQTVDLSGEGVLLAVTGAVDPPHSSPRGLGGEGVEHGQYRGGADPGAEQHDRAGVRAQDERATGCSDVEGGTSSHVPAEVVTDDAVGLELDADAVAGSS
jgi:hypothetical protein